MICISWPNYWADFSTGCNVTRHTQIFYFVFNLYFVLNNLSVHIVIRIGIRDRGGSSCPPPPSVVRNINLSGNFYLRVGQSSCSCQWNEYNWNATSIVIDGKIMKPNFAWYFTQTRVSGWSITRVSFATIPRTNYEERANDERTTWRQTWVPRESKFSV